MAKYALGLDFGTESGRALLVNVATGEEIAQSVCEYAHGVITEHLPTPGATRLGRDWALQHPDDYLEALTRIVRAVMQESGAAPEDVVGIGVDFTACTIMPTTADGTPLCTLERFRDDPNAWVKLWKHHAADPETREILALARERKEPFLPYYGNAISSEWLLPKALQVLRESPEVYAAAECIVEGGDWITWKLTGELVRNACASGYKAMWVDVLGYPSEEFLGAIDPGITNLYKEKVTGPIRAAGERAGLLTEAMAQELGLAAGTPVSPATIDAHAGVPASYVTEPGVMAIIMGTSSCHMLLNDRAVLFEGFVGVVKDGIIKGYYGYESGQTAVGDIFAWFVDNCTPPEIAEEAEKSGRSRHDVLTERAQGLRPGESGLLALDWWNGNRSILMNAALSGLLVGATLDTRAEEIYRALIEGTAFGTRKIIESYVQAGIPIRKIVACGGLAERNPMLLQINADVINRPIEIAASGQAVALGAAMFGALAAGKENRGYDTIAEAARHMVQPATEVYEPIPENARVYEQLYAEYDRLHDLFGRTDPVMQRLRKIAGQ